MTTKGRRDGKEICRCTARDGAGHDGGRDNAGIACIEPFRDGRVGPSNWEPAPADGTSRARITSAQTIRTVWRLGTLKEFDIGRPGITPGDPYVFAGPLYDRTDTERIDYLSGNCVFAAPNFHGLATCTVTATPHLEGPSPGFGDQIASRLERRHAVPLQAGDHRRYGHPSERRGDVLAEPGEPFRITFGLLP